MSAPSLRLATLQTKAEPLRYDENRRAVEELLSEVSRHRPDIVVMPELFLSGHGVQRDRNSLKENVEDGPTRAWMSEWSKRLGALLVGGILEAIPGDEHCFSTLLLVDGDSLIGKYRKRHPASVELLFLRPGSDPGTFETRLGRIALLTCFDMSFPDSTLSAFESQPDLLLVSNAWLMLEHFPFLAGQSFDHHRVLPRALAMQLRVPVAVANLVGRTEAVVPGLPAFGGGVFRFQTEFAGGSLVCDHMGVVLAERPRQAGTGIVVADVSPALAESVRDVTVNGAGLGSMSRHVFGGDVEIPLPLPRAEAIS